MTNNNQFSLLFLTPIFLVIAAFTSAEARITDEKQQITIDHLLSLSLEDLLNVEITSASGVEERLRDAPAAMIVISSKDIQRRGYHRLDEIFADLPGFDISKTNGDLSTTAYQRGYRTSRMERILFLVNGVEENHLWSHSPVLSSQYPLSGIERIEVLYGPVSVVYGPNAFLGVVNIITKDAKELTYAEHHAEANLLLGSYQSRGVDATLLGRQGDWHYRLSGKGFVSNEPDLDDYAEWGFLTNDWLSNRDVWGAVLDESHDGVSYGEFHDPTDNWGVMGEVGFKDVKLGLINWKTQEGYGVLYTADHAQPSPPVEHGSLQTYIQHEWAANDVLSITNQILYRENHIRYKWVEAVTDWDNARYSYLSISDWHSKNHSWLFTQDYDYQVSDRLRLTGGLKYETKTLTKSYDVCSYWEGTYCSTDTGDTGPYGLGSGVFRSTDPEVTIAPGTSGTMPADNLAKTRDIGVYLQAHWQYKDWLWIGGLRYDRNSLYGSTINPRISTVYKWSDKTTIKLLYGEAFQEPSPRLLWGGWNQRAANPNLKPEKARNLELILIHQTENWLHDMSLFAADYENVIQDDAPNFGSRDVFGLEYRGRFTFPNVINHAPDISGYLYYTYTRTDSSIHYDHTLEKWVEGEAELGDIAPHKINVGLDIPFNHHWYAHLRANYVSAKQLYLRNPLREAGRKVGSYTVFDLTLGYQHRSWDVSLKTENLFNTSYYHSGGGAANSGDDFSQRAVGFENSLVPQPKRSFWLNVRWCWD